MKRILLIAAGIAAASAASAQYLPWVSYDFDTPTTSPEITVRKSSADADAQWGYDFSTYTRNPLYTGPATIPQSPNATTSATGALRLRSNVTNNDLLTDAVNVFLTTTPLNQFRMTLDVYHNYNGPAFGGSASTEFSLYGVGDGTRVEWPNSGTAGGSSGWFFTNTGEGGAAQDARYYEGQGPTLGHIGNTAARPAPTVNYNGVPNWFGQNNLTQDMANTAGGTSWGLLLQNPAYETTGTISKNWATYEIEVNGTSVTVFLTPVDKPRTQIGSWLTQAAFPGQVPFVGYMDIFTGVMSDQANRRPEQFLLVDNVRIEVPEVVATAREWQLYE